MPRIGERHRGLSHVDRAVGATLRDIRLRRGLSQMTLAKRLGISFQQIQKYEAGSNSIATARIPALCDALHITPNELFGPRSGGADSAPLLSESAVKLAYSIDRLSGPVVVALSQLVAAMLEGGLMSGSEGFPSGRHLGDDLGGSDEPAITSEPSTALATRVIPENGVDQAIAQHEMDQQLRERLRG